jgi:hypothetical protein
MRSRRNGKPKECSRKNTAAFRKRARCRLTGREKLVTGGSK